MVNKLSLGLPKHIRWRPSREMMIRVIADALMVNAVLIAALIFRYLWMIGVEGIVGSAREVLRAYIQVYVESCWVLTLISLTVFHFSGFYFQSRFYTGRYKVVVIAQAVSLSYLVFSFFILLRGDAITFPRSVLIMGWFLTLITLIGVRIWLVPLITTLRRERPPISAPSPADDRITNVLVIGGAGYIGSALLPRLLEKGYNVRVLDLLLYGIEPIEALMGHPNLEIIQGDFLQMGRVMQAMRGMDAVIHLGAIVGDPACELSPGLTIEVNLIATRMIAEMARCLKAKRMIFASTCSVYGASDEVLDERSSLKPVSLYASSKVASEKVLLSLAGTDFSPVILRFGTVYGLSGRTRFDLVVNLMTAKAVKDGKITVYGGDQWRPFVHVDDAALAILMVLEAPLPLVWGEIYNVGCNAQNYTIRQVAKIIKTLTPAAEVVYVGMDSDIRNYCVDFSRIQKLIGFTPQWTVEQGVEQVLDAIRGGKISNYQAPQYSNVEHLRGQDIVQLSPDGHNWTYDLLNEMKAQAKADDA